MIMVLSLLEGRTDQLVIKRIFRQLPLDLLKKNLVTVYLRYKYIYEEKGKLPYIMDVFDHAE